MLKHLHKGLLIGFSLTLIQEHTIAQDHIGLATGNFSGVSAVSFNPSYIADSRHKFDINLFSFNSYFNNNLVDIKRDAFYRGLFFKEPYNTDYSAVRRDLLTLRTDVGNQRVNAFVDAKIQAPLSMMITTGKKSAIALNIRSRASFRVDNMARNTAQLLYEGLNNPALYGMNENNNGFETNYLRWQEVGLTYARTIVNSGPHFLKAGFTGKWLMGQAAAYIQSDNLQARFNSANTLSLQSPQIRYYRSEQGDIDGFNTSSFFKDIEDHRFGWDAGITYEFRGRFNNFKYVGEDNKTAERRDVNKYTFRLAAAIVDAGRLTFNKQALTNDHSANFNDWNFSQVKANSFSDFDTAYSTQVQYMAGAKSNFTMALPTALSANLDLHLHRGFYINAAMYKPLASFNKDHEASMRAAQWYAVTPRFESRQIGVYVPIVFTEQNKRTDVGLTLRLGPLFVGSSNLGSYVFNEKLAAVDVHAGVKIGITHGKSSKFLKSLEKATKLKGLTDTEVEIEEPAKYYLSEKQLKGLDSLLATVKLSDSLRIADSLKAITIKAQNEQLNAAKVQPTSPVVNVVINNYLNGTAPASNPIVVQKAKDTVIINNQLPAALVVKTDSLVNKNKLDSVLKQRETEIDYLIKRSAENELRLRELAVQRSEDSLTLNELKTQRDKLESIVTDSIATWKRMMNAPATKQVIEEKAPAEVEKKRFRLFKKKEKTTEAEPTALINETPAPIAEQPVIVYTPVTDNDLSKREIKRMERSNNDLEDEMKRLRKQMNENTAMVAAATTAAAANAAQLAATNNQKAMLVDSLLSIKPTGIVDTALVNAINRNTLAASTRLRDTLVIRDTVYMPAKTVVLQATPITIPVVEPVEPKKVEVTLPKATAIFFGVGSTAIGATGKQNLNKLSSTLKAYPNEYAVNLTGRTDATGSIAINQKIARQRTQSVSNYLVTKGISSSRITSTIEVEQDKTKKADAQSRRVDIEIKDLVTK